MIVEKIWITRKEEKEPGYKTIDCDVVRKWRGWFLFGIIPLYVKNYETLYK